MLCKTYENNWYCYTVRDALELIGYFERTLADISCMYVQDEISYQSNRPCVVLVQSLLCQLTEVTARKQACHPNRSHYSDTERANRSSLFLHKYGVLGGEAVTTTFKVFGVTLPVIEPTTTRTRGEHATLGSPLRTTTKLLACSALRYDLIYFQ